MCIARVANFAVLLVAELVHSLCVVAAHVGTRARIRSIRIVRGIRIRRTAGRTAADDGREYEQSLRVIDGCGYRRAIGVVSPIAALRRIRLDAPRLRSIQIVHLVVTISVVETLIIGKLAERIAVDHAANIWVVVERSASAMPVVKGTVAAGRVAEDDAATRNSTNVAANGHKVRAAIIACCPSNAKAARRFHRHAIDDIVTAHDATDHAAKKRARHARGVFILMCNRGRLARVFNVQITHNATVAIRDQPRKRTCVLGVVDLDSRLRSCLRRAPQITNDNATERVIFITQALKNGSVQLKRVSAFPLVVLRLDAVVGTLEIAVHRRIVKRVIGVDVVPDHSHPCFARLLVDVRHFITSILAGRAALA